MKGSRETPAHRCPHPRSAAKLVRGPQELNPFFNVQKDASLPPEPVCNRLSDVLALVEPRFGAALLDATGREALQFVADRIPALLSPFWGIEVRLGDPAPRADLLWQVRQTGGGIPTLAGRDLQVPGADIADALRERSPFWRELGCFAGEWLDSPEWLGLLDNIWLEADTASATGAGLDACLDRPNLFWGPNGRTEGSDRELLGRLESLGERFYGLKPDRSRMAAIVDALPLDAFVFQMGIMGARTMPVVRLCVKNLDTDRQVRWLADIGWPGDRAALRDTLTRLEPVCGEIALDLDILPNRIGERLGLEVYSIERVLSMDTWRPLHDDLLAQGLARADKLAALEDFPWFQRFRHFGPRSRVSTFRFPALVTNLHHLKLVFAVETVLEAKAYLGVFRPAIDYSRTKGGDVEGAGGWM